jgi:hypothetical protein
MAGTKLTKEQLLDELDKHTPVIGAAVSNLFEDGHESIAGLDVINELLRDMDERERYAFMNGWQACQMMDSLVKFTALKSFK